MNTIRNPILPGFHPDPCILRVGDDYYIANSTFEWFPGVILHHSRDLVHWRPIGHALTRRSQLDLVGDPDSGGVWAPALSYDGERFYLVYTDQKSWDSRYYASSTWMLDCMNYLVTADRIEGPWSDPVFLHARGFDPSLLHDEDGRKWLASTLWDHRQDKRHFGGIILQEYCPRQQKLIGPVRNIFPGTRLGVTEGPHILKHDGYYYLITAEGGTSYEHAVTVARSRSITGPYEVHPRNPILTSAHDPSLALQKAGHASLVQTPAREWYMAHLCARPISSKRRCPLGRETALQPVVWSSDGWPELLSGASAPQLEVVAPSLPASPTVSLHSRDDFDDPELRADYQTLRDPADPSWFSLSHRPGYLRLYGRESIASRHHQSLVGRRLQSLNTLVQAEIEYSPTSFQQMAGLALFYDVRHYYYLAVTYDESVGRCLRLYRNIQGSLDEPSTCPVPLKPGPVRLETRITDSSVQFSHSVGGQRSVDIGPALDLSELSDEVAGGFTGVFIALCSQDLTGNSSPADFAYLSA